METKVWMVYVCQPDVTKLKMREYRVGRTTTEWDEERQQNVTFTKWEVDRRPELRCGGGQTWMRWADEPGRVCVKVFSNERQAKTAATVASNLGLNVRVDEVMLEAF